MTKKRQRKNNNFSNTYWMYGTHACIAAILNEDRAIRKILCTKNAEVEIRDAMDESYRDPMPHFEIREGFEIEKMLGRGAVHQGVAMEVSALEGEALEEVIDLGKPLLVLDQVTDPQNVGAMLRSAAAFDFGAIIMPKDNSAKEGNAMAKIACGALDMIPLVQVTNLSQAMELCKKEGYWAIGLDGHTDKNITDVSLDAKSLIVMGAEGKGLRHKTREHCDHLVKLPMSDQMESLNVSNAAAIAMYSVFTAIK